MKKYYQNIITNLIVILVSTTVFAQQNIVVGGVLQLNNTTASVPNKAPTDVLLVAQNGGELSAKTNVLGYKATFFEYSILTPNFTGTQMPIAPTQPANTNYYFLQTSSFTESTPFDLMGTLFIGNITLQPTNPQAISSYYTTLEFVAELYNSDGVMQGSYNQITYPFSDVIVPFGFEINILKNALPAGSYYFKLYINKRAFSSSNPAAADYTLSYDASQNITFSKTVFKNTSL